MPPTAPPASPRRRGAAAVALSLSALMGLTGCMGGGASSSNMNPALVAGAGGKNAQNAAADCLAPGSAAFDAMLATGESGELSEEQNENAQAIIGVAEERGLGPEGAAIGIATALVESDLINVDYGDDRHGVTNPDGTLTTSLGLFQQQESWGSEEERMDPSASAGLFYDRLEEKDWESMDPGEAAQSVQVSAFPDKYGQRMSEAEAIVESVGTGFTEGDDSGDDSEAEDDSSASSDASDSSAEATDSASEAEDDSSASDSATEDSDDDSDSASTSSSSSSTANNCSTSGTGAVTAGSEEGDDVPDEHKPDSRFYDAGFSPETDPWGLYKGQCVSYVAWRLNVSMGYDPEEDGDDYPFTTQKMGMAGQANANYWSDALGKKGYETDDEPKPGAVAWWDSFSGYTGEAGHVAIVEHVGEGENEGKVYVSQYNAAPETIRYSEQWVDIDEISGFIHVADYPDGETRIPEPK